MLKTLRRKTFKDLRANKGQFLAVWLIVVLGTTFYGALYPAALNLLASLYRTYDDLQYMDFQVQADSIDAATLEAARAIPGVESAETRLVIDGGLQVKPDQQYLINLRLISVPDDRRPDVSRSEVIDGHALSEPGEILLLESFADFHGFKPGDDLSVMIGEQMVSLRIAGIVFNPEYVVLGRSPESPFPTPSTFGVAWMRYSELSALAGRTGEYNELVVHLEGGFEDDRSQLEDSVQAGLNTVFAGQPDAVIFSRYQTASGGVVDANAKGNFPIMMFYSGLFLLGALLITSILLARMVESERQRIGTMRAMGVTRRELVIHYLAFGFIVGLTGGLVGSVLGYFNSFIVMYTFIGYFVQGTLPGFVNTPQMPFILLGFALVVVGSTIAGAYPAWAQSATPPGIALRPATPSTPNILSRTSLRFLPLPVRQTIRNLLRAPGRSLSTAVGVLVGSMMLFSALALWDTMDFSFGTYFEGNDFDLRVATSAFLPEETLQDQIDPLAHVEAVQAALVGPVTISNRAGETLDTVAVSVDETDPFFDLTILDGTQAFSSSDGVWIGNNVRRVLGLDTGDMLTLRAFNQQRQVRVLGVASQVLGAPVFIPRGLLVQWTPGGSFPANVALVRTEPGQEAMVRESLAGQPGILSVELMDDFERDVNHYIEWYRVNTLIFGGFGVILTLALLFNSVNASLRERRSELSVLRALGTTGREIALTVTLEMLLMTVVGALIGVPAGRAAGFWMNSAYNLDFFGQINQLRLIWYILGISGLALVVVLAEIPGLRAVQKIDLGQVSKSQSF